jgi:hypothetical protein
VRCRTGPIRSCRECRNGDKFALIEPGQSRIDKIFGRHDEVSREIAYRFACQIPELRAVALGRRAGGQSQHSELLALSPKSDRIQNALSFAEKNLGSSQSVDKLAEVANLNARQFSRALGNRLCRSAQDARGIFTNLGSAAANHPAQRPHLKRFRSGFEQMRP